MHSTRSCSLCAVSVFFVINISLSINLELSANGICGIFNSHFGVRDTTILLQKSQTWLIHFWCLESLIQSAEAFTKAVKAVGSHDEETTIVMMTSA